MFADCGEIQLSIVEFHGKDLEPGVLAHVESCPGCRKVLETVQGIEEPVVREADETSARIPVRLSPYLSRHVLEEIVKGRYEKERYQGWLGSWRRFADMLEKRPVLRFCVRAVPVFVLLVGICVHAYFKREQYMRMVAAFVPADTSVRVVDGLVATSEAKGSWFDFGDHSRGALSNSAVLKLAGDRRVQLHKGSVWLDVTPDGRGFQVDTAFGLVTVLGTNFGVSLAGDNLRVEVARGTVTVTPPGGAPSPVSAGQIALAKTGGPGFALQAREAGQLVPRWVRDLQFPEAPVYESFDINPGTPVMLSKARGCAVFAIGGHRGGRGWVGPWMSDDANLPGDERYALLQRKEGVVQFPPGIPFQVSPGYLFMDSAFLQNPDQLHWITRPLNPSRLVVDLSVDAEYYLTWIAGNEAQNTLLCVAFREKVTGRGLGAGWAPVEGEDCHTIFNFVYGAGEIHSPATRRSCAWGRSKFLCAGRPHPYFYILRIESRANQPDRAFLKALSLNDPAPQSPDDLQGEGIEQGKWDVIMELGNLRVKLDEIAILQMGRNSRLFVDELRAGTTWRQVMGN